MESQLQNDSKKAMQIQEQKVQLEERVVKLRHSEREMRNTLEKFTASIQVCACVCVCVCSCAYTRLYMLDFYLWISCY